MNIFKLISITILITFSGNAAALVLQSRIDISADDYSFSTDNLDLATGLDAGARFTDGDRLQISDTLPMLSLGLLAANINGYFIDVYYSENITEGDQSPIQFFSNGEEAFEPIKINRYETAISAGKVINNNWTLGVGFRDGESDISQQHGLVLGGERQIFFENSSKFQLSGPFLVAAYSIDVGKNSKFSLKAGLTDLSGDWEVITQRDGLGTTTTTNNLSGDATGLNVGARFNVPFSENSNWSWRFGIDYYSYDFDVAGLSTEESANSEGDFTSLTSSISANIEEELLSLKIGLSYSF